MKKTWLFSSFIFVLVLALFLGDARPLRHQKRRQQKTLSYLAEEETPLHLIQSQQQKAKPSRSQRICLKSS